MRRRIGWAAITVIIAGVFLTTARAGAADKTAAELLPGSTAAYVEVARPAEVISALLDSSLSQKIQKSPQFQKALENPKFQEFLTIVGAVEQKAGVTWRRALENGTAGGIVLAFDADTKGLVVLAKSQDPKVTESIRDAVFSLAREDAKNKGNPDPIEPIDYRDLKAWRAGEVILSQLGPWLLLSNNPELAKKVASQFLDGGADLAVDAQFQAARQTVNDPAAARSAWAFVRLDALRATAGDKPFLDPKYKSDNPAAEFLFGGFLPMLWKAPYAAASLTVHDDEIKLSIATANDPTWTPAQKKFFFGAPGDGAAKPLRPPGTLLSMTIYRDLSAMWQSGPDLFTEDAAARMAQTDSGLSPFVGGKSFSRDVLGALRPQMQFILTRQDFKAAGIPAPALKLPGGALVFRVKPKFDSVRTRLRAGFQTAIGLVNLDGATKGRPVLELQSEKRAGIDIQFATYDLKEKATNKDDFYLNFSPALVMSKNYVILCSTKQIAEDLADLISKEGDTQPTISDNVLIEIDGSGAAALLREDREQLIAKDMLEKGHDRADAEKEVDFICSIADSFRGATIRVTPTERMIKLEVDVKYGK